MTMTRRALCPGHRVRRAPGPLLARRELLALPGRLGRLGRLGRRALLGPVQARPAAVVQAALGRLREVRGRPG